MTLLIISHNPLLVDQIETEVELRQAPVRVVGKCYSMEEGMKAVQALRPEVVLLDAEFSGATGAELLSRLKPATESLIILTEEEKKRQRMEQLGFAVVSCNPFDAALLFETMLGCLHLPRQGNSTGP